MAPKSDLNPRYPRLEKNGSYTIERSALAFNNEPADTTKLKDVDRTRLLIKGYERLKEDAKVEISDEVFARLREMLRRLEEEYDNVEDKDRELLAVLGKKTFALWFGLLLAN